jgi:ribosome biogenesis GTPase A
VIWERAGRSLRRRAAAGLLALVLALTAAESAGAGASEPRRMPRKANVSGKARKEYLKGKKEERKTSGRGAGFSSVVCDWGSTAVSVPVAGSVGQANEPAAAVGDARQSSIGSGSTWTGAQLLGTGEASARREQRAPKSGRAGGENTKPGLLVQAPRNKLSTFFEREDDAAVQLRKLDATRPLERQRHAAQDGWAHIAPRPLPWPLPLVGGAFAPIIPVPKRPPWRRDMSAGELEQQEQAMFVKWTEGIFAQYDRSQLNHFEHNLEVWRQLWRAIERSDLAVFVLDARLPFFHFQQAMWDYVTKDMGREAVICINKADLVHPHVVHLWIEFFKERMPGVPVVAFYVPKSSNRGVGQPCVEQLLEAIASCRVTRNGVKMPCSHFMQDLLHGACRAQAGCDAPAHEHEHAQHGAAASCANEAPFGMDGAAIDDILPAGRAQAAAEGEEEAGGLAGRARRENPYMTVCLVGDPNMGKSSLMNSIFGRKIVSSSSTPGHTKHIQTYFLSKTFCMCDAPGIVCPRIGIPRELQVVHFPACSLSCAHTRTYSLSHALCDTDKTPRRPRGVSAPRALATGDLRNIPHRTSS